MFFPISYKQRAKEFACLSLDPAAQDIDGIDPDESAMGRRTEAFFEAIMYRNQSMTVYRFGPRTA
jgi:hypothetical protein